MAKRRHVTEAETDLAPESTRRPFRSAADPGVLGEPVLCPFLATEGPDGALRSAIGWPAPTNRCTALGDAQPQSDRQQALVCLTAGHANCPRFLRGILIAGELAQEPSRPPASAAVGGSALVLPASPA